MIEDILYYIGQFLGIAAVVLGFVTFQLKTPKRILACQSTCALVFALHYLLIGALGAAALNLLAAFNDILYFFRAKRGSHSLFEPIFYITMITVTSILTWEAWYTVILMCGLYAAAIGLSLSNPQTTRKVMLIKAPLCLAYNALVLSVGGVIYESAVLASAIIGLIRNRQKSLDAPQKL